MKYDHRDGTFKLSTGRRLRANGEFLLGLSSTYGVDGTTALLYGYDGSSHVEAAPWQVEAADNLDDDERPLAAEERQEIARYMIEAWQRWAETGRV